MEKKAIIIKNNSNNYEVRCRNCGKLLFVFKPNYSFCVDKKTQSVKIVSRCTRSGCKTDNILDI